MLVYAFTPFFVFFLNEAYIVRAKVFRIASNSSALKCLMGTCVAPWRVHTYIQI